MAVQTIPFLMSVQKQCPFVIKACLSEQKYLLLWALMHIIKAIVIHLLSKWKHVFVLFVCKCTDDFIV